MKTLFKKQNTQQTKQDEHLELLELKRELKTLADVVLEDAAEIDAFFEDQLRIKKCGAAITPKSNWNVIKRYLEQWTKINYIEPNTTN